MRFDVCEVAVLNINCIFNPENVNECNFSFVESNSHCIKVLRIIIFRCFYYN